MAMRMSLPLEDAERVRREAALVVAAEVLELRHGLRRSKTLEDLGDQFDHQTWSMCDGEHRYGIEEEPSVGVSLLGVRTVPGGGVAWPPGHQQLGRR